MEMAGRLNILSVERLGPPTDDIHSADCFAIPGPPQTGEGGPDQNSPLGRLT